MLRDHMTTAAAATLLYIIQNIYSEGFGVYVPSTADLSARRGRRELEHERIVSQSFCSVCEIKRQERVCSEKSQDNDTCDVTRQQPK